MHKVDEESLRRTSDINPWLPHAWPQTCTVAYATPLHDRQVSGRPTMMLSEQCRFWGEPQPPQTLWTFLTASRRQVQICIQYPFNFHNCPRSVRSLPITNCNSPGTSGAPRSVKSVILSLIFLVKLPSEYASTNSPKGMCYSGPETHANITSPALIHSFHMDLAPDIKVACEGRQLRSCHLKTLPSEE